MKTRFQISMQRGSPAFTSEPCVSPAGVRSTWNSEHGPHGPVSPIIQKLSFLFPLTMCTAGSSPAAVKVAPNVVRFLVDSARLVGSGSGKPSRRGVRREAPALNDQLPRPFDRFLFEIIAEAPVAEHLEKGVVVGVESDIFEVVMLAAGANALLGVRNPCVVATAAFAGPGRSARTGSCRHW